MTTYRTTRDFAAPVADVFAALADPARLARWWGPAGFRNTFAVCEFRSGGRWSFVMHGPDGHDYPNESTFETVTAPHTVVIRHASAPLFRLTVSLAPTATGTRVEWTQAFDDAETGRRLAAIVEPANEQNLDRWQAEVAGRAAP